MRTTVTAGMSSPHSWCIQEVSCTDIRQYFVHCNKTRQKYNWLSKDWQNVWFCGKFLIFVLYKCQKNFSTATTSIKFSSVIQLDGWQQSATHRSYPAPAVRINCRHNKRLQHFCFFKKGWVGTSDAPGEALCENMNSFFQPASKDKHNLEVKYPFSWAAKHDNSPSLTYLQLLLALSLLSVKKFKWWRRVKRWLVHWVTGH